MECILKNETSCVELDGELLAGNDDIFLFFNKMSSLIYRIGSINICWLNQGLILLPFLGRWIF